MIRYNSDNVVDYVLKHYSYIAGKIKALKLTEAEMYQVISRIFGYDLEDFYAEALVITLNRKDFLLTLKETDFPIANDLSFTLSSGKRVYIAQLGDYD